VAKSAKKTAIQKRQRNFFSCFYSQIPRNVLYKKESGKKCFLNIKNGLDFAVSFILCLCRRWAADGILSYSLHPGWVRWVTRFTWVAGFLSLGPGNFPHQNINS
jgi:hypothetical protein